MKTLITLIVTLLALSQGLIPALAQSFEDCGAHVSFVTLFYPSPDGSKGNWKFMKVDDTLNSPAQPVHLPGEAQDVSSDGSEVVVQTPVDEIVIMNTNGENQRMLDGGWFPRMSASGRYISYNSSGYNLKIYDRVAKESWLVVQEDGSPIVDLQLLAWNPGADTVMIPVFKAEGQDQLREYDPAQRRFVRTWVTAEPGTGLATPVWGKEWLAWLVWQDMSTNIAVMNIASGEVQTMDMEGYQRNLDFGPDDTLAFVDETVDWTRPADHPYSIAQSLWVVHPSDLNNPRSLVNIPGNDLSNPEWICQDNLVVESGYGVGGKSLMTVTPSTGAMLPFSTPLSEQLPEGVGLLSFITSGQ